MSLVPSRVSSQGCADRGRRHASQQDISAALSCVIWFNFAARADFTEILASRSARTVLAAMFEALAAAAADIAGAGVTPRAGLIVTSLPVGSCRRQAARYRPIIETANPVISDTALREVPAFRSSTTRDSRACPRMKCDLGTGQFYREGKSVARAGSYPPGDPDPLRRRAGFRASTPNLPIFNPDTTGDSDGSTIFHGHATFWRLRVSP